MNKTREAVIDWCRDQQWDYAFTFTFPSEATKEHRKKTMRLFWNKMDRKYYGHSVGRFGVRIKRLSMIEGRESDNNWHYHAAVASPTGKPSTLFLIRAMSTWNSLWFAGDQEEYEEIYDSRGWLTYITKNITNTNTDAIDAFTTHL
jgi:hypothetical protein